MLIPHAVSNPSNVAMTHTIATAWIAVWRFQPVRGDSVTISTAHTTKKTQLPCQIAMKIPEARGRFILTAASPPTYARIAYTTLTMMYGIANTSNRSNGMKTVKAKKA
ncbi:MAG TPA: hypothetical protein VGM51_01385 [Armatimonadota bacterium]|jgi:hypothetical protein